MAKTLGGGKAEEGRAGIWKEGRFLGVAKGWGRRVWTLVAVVARVGSLEPGREEALILSGDVLSGFGGGSIISTLGDLSILTEAGEELLAGGRGLRGRGGPGGSL